jgi:hypothetical protein
VAEGVEKPESNSEEVDDRRDYSPPPGSKSMACSESVRVNVGGPTPSRRDMSIN